ncbi:MAG: HDOD domain-containing protein [Desulfamplus sp.]|nr:HDOD domain-containing protein [Desulfamplus sp.]
MINSANNLIKQYKQIKTLPHVAIRLTQLLSEPYSTIQDFEKLIKMDPTLVGRLLSLVNSAYYGLRQRVNSISEAIVFLGMDNLRNLVVTSALKDIFKADFNNPFFSVNKLWLHCATSAICCQMISERIFSKRGEDAFLCGILHDIGMIVEYQVVPDQFLQACQIYKPEEKTFIKFERDVLNTDHCETGYLLAGDWKVPRQVQEGIQDHHNSNKKVEPSSISGIIQLSEYIITKMNYPAITAMHPTLSPELALFFKKNFNELKVMIQTMPEEIKKAKEIYE